VLRSTSLVTLAHAAMFASLCTLRLCVRKAFSRLKSEVIEQLDTDRGLRVGSWW